MTKQDLPSQSGRSRATPANRVRSVLLISVGLVSALALVALLHAAQEPGSATDCCPCAREAAYVNDFTTNGLVGRTISRERARARDALVECIEQWERLAPARPANVWRSDGRR